MYSSLIQGLAASPIYFSTSWILVSLMICFGQLIWWIWCVLGFSPFFFFFFPLFFFFFFKFYFIFKLNITVLDLPNIKMNPPQWDLVFKKTSKNAFPQLPCKEAGLAYSRVGEPRHSSHHQPAILDVLTSLTVELNAPAEEPEVKKAKRWPSQPIELWEMTLLRGSKLEVVSFVVVDIWSHICFHFGHLCCL